MRYFSIFALIAFSFTVAASDVAAQQNAVTIEEALQICNGIRNAQDKLDCFEGLAEAASPNQNQATETNKNNMQLDPADPYSGPVEALKPSTPVLKEQSDQESKKRFVILPAEEAEERLAAKKSLGQKRQKYRATIRKAWVNGERRLFLLLDTGEVYKQIEGSLGVTPSEGAKVELRPGMVGGWFVELKQGYPAMKMRLINK